MNSSTSARLPEVAENALVDAWLTFGLSAFDDARNSFRRSISESMT